MMISKLLEKMKLCLCMHDAEIIDDPDNLRFIFHCEWCNTKEEVPYRDLVGAKWGLTPQWLELREPFWIVVQGTMPVSLPLGTIHLVRAKTEGEAINRVFNGPPPAKVDYDIFLPDYLVDHERENVEEVYNHEENNVP